MEIAQVIQQVPTLLIMTKTDLPEGQVEDQDIMDAKEKNGMMTCDYHTSSQQDGSENQAIQKIFFYAFKYARMYKE